jgi:hypothetical protein
MPSITEARYPQGGDAIMEKKFFVLGLLTAAGCDQKSALMNAHESATPADGSRQNDGQSDVVAEAAREAPRVDNQLEIAVK